MNKNLVGFSRGGFGFPSNNHDDHDDEDANAHDM